MRWPWSKDIPEDGDTLRRAQARADEVVERGHRVAASLEGRLARNHFATMVAQTMTGETR